MRISHWSSDVCSSDLNAAAGLAALEAFAEGHWGQKYPAIAQSWRRHWDQVIPFIAFSEAIRRIIYTTNALQALNSKLRRAVRTRGRFLGNNVSRTPSDPDIIHADDRTGEEEEKIVTIGSDT